MVPPKISKFIYKVLIKALFNLMRVHEFHVKYVLITKWIKRNLFKRREVFKSVDCNSNILKVNFSVIFVYLVFYASLNCVIWFIQHETIYVSLGPYRFHDVHLTIHSSVHKHFFWFDNKSFEKFIKTERPIENFGISHDVFSLLQD